MNKIHMLTIIVCTLTSSNSFSMLRFLRTNHRPYARMCYTRTFDALPKPTIHNSSETEISANASFLIEDHYYRNSVLKEHLLKQIENSQDIIKELHKQNAIIINHTYNDESLDIAMLKSSESTLRKKITKYAHINANIYQSITENKQKGHANE